MGCTMVGPGRLVGCVAGALSVVAVAMSAYASPGDLDTAFGTTGVVTYHYPGPFIGDKANAVAVQSDGKVVVAGTSNQNGNARIAVARWNANGTLDPTFGTGGTILQVLVGGDSGFDILLQPDGKIVVGGTTAGNTGNINFVVLRYTTAGVLDSTWGVSGVATTDFAGGHDVLGGIALQSDGKIVAAGTVQSVGLGVARYNSDGTPDTSFGTAGKYTNGSLSNVRRVALQGDGKILAVGGANVACNPCGDFGVVRINTNGTTDTAFGTSGLAAIDISGPDRGQALAVQADGAIVVVGGQGFGFSGAANFGIVRLLASGAIDPSFGTGGKVTVNAGGGSLLDEAYGIVLEPSGGITVAGEDQSGDKLLVRLTPAGALDPLFGTGGISKVIGGGGLYDVERMSDGRLVGAGGGNDLAVARYFNNVCADGNLEPGEQCDDANTTNGDCCSSACQFESASTICRPAADDCDVADHCTGASGTCPADGVKTNGVACTDDGNVCTLDQCNGVSSACQHPPASNTTACADDGELCTVDACDGAGNCAHPAGNLGTPCRASAGECDVAEACDGSSPTCPPNGFAMSGTSCSGDANPCTVDACNGAGSCAHPAGNPGSLCRAAAGQCDVAEHCTGASTVCPADDSQPDGTPCDDANACTTDESCSAGACGGGAPATCALCQVCVAPGGCVDAPATGCKLPIEPLKALLELKDGATDARDKVTFKWVKGADVALAEFGNPVNTDDYAVCVYDESGPTPTLLFKGTAPHAGTCGTKPCWKQTGRLTAPTGFKYADKELTPDGTSSVVLKAGLLGKSKAVYLGKKENLNLAPFVALPLPLRAQIQGTNGACYEATFNSSGMRVNANGHFKGRAD